MRNLAVTLSWFAYRVEHRVVPLNERDQIGMVTLVGDALPVLVPVQHGLVVIQGTTLGPEAPGTNLNSLCHSSTPMSCVSQQNVSHQGDHIL